jgi:hypothetical protein
MSTERNQLMDIFSPQQVIERRNKLGAAAQKIVAAQRAMIEADIAFRTYKATELGLVTEQLENIKGAVALAAVLDGKIDGKNAETRALQQAAVLAEDDAVSAAQEDVLVATLKLYELEAKALEAKAAYDFEVNSFKADLALADYDTAILAVLTTP